MVLVYIKMDPVWLQIQGVDVRVRPRWGGLGFLS
jgi:hypothetical protein